MLEKLTIQNVALIERAEIEFGPGLNILSGETGAGKSVILDSINFVLGAKADRSMIRYGEDACSVRAVFRTEGSGLSELLRDMDIEADDELIVSRRLRSDGRGDIKVNGESVNAAMLRRLTARLVDVHGQSEHFYLLSEANQLALIDRMAGERLSAPKGQLASLLAENRALQAKIKSLGGDEAERSRRMDILRYQLDEIERAALQEGEEEALAAKKLFYANIEKIMRSLSAAVEAMTGEGAAVDNLQAARRSLADIGRYGEEYASAQARLESLALEAEDVGETLGALAEELVYDENEAEEVENRLDHIKSLKKKYGASVAEINAYGEKIAAEYDLLAHCDEEFAKCTAQIQKNGVKIAALCREITAIRKQTAEIFCGKVEGELRTLAIANARFAAQFDEYDDDTMHPGADGADSMRFLFSANAGEPFKPLSKVISGGEMSRLMLAIKTCMSGTSDIETYIFDEIDAGISGRAAKTVAEKFADISAHIQIVAVSHLAQIVAMADRNFYISKSETPEGKTVTSISPLSAEDSRKEIIRLLGGEAGSDAAQRLAAELAESCIAYKNSRK